MKHLLNAMFSASVFLATGLVGTPGPVAAQVPRHNIVFEKGVVLDAVVWNGKLRLAAVWTGAKVGHYPVKFYNPRAGYRDSSLMPVYAAVLDRRSCAVGATMRIGEGDAAFVALGRLPRAGLTLFPQPPSLMMKFAANPMDQFSRWHFSYCTVGSCTSTCPPRYGARGPEMAAALFDFKL